MSRRVLLPKIYVTANLNFFIIIIFNFYLNRKLENKKHFLDMPAVSKSWSTRAVFTVILEESRRFKSTRIHGLSAFLD